MHQMPAAAVVSVTKVAPMSQPTHGGGMTTPQHASNLPAPGAYVRAWQRVKQSPEGSHFNLDWMRPRVPRDEVLREFNLALQRRINIRGGRHEDNEPIPAEWIRDCRRVHDRLQHRVIVRQFETEECRQRFAHLLQGDDA